MNRLLAVAFWLVAYPVPAVIDIWFRGDKGGFGYQWLWALGWTVVQLGLAVYIVARTQLGIGARGPGTPDHVLVTHGLYALVRHPAYAALFVAQLGLVVAMGSFAGLAYLIVVESVALTWAGKREDLALSLTYGEQYRDYQHVVGAFWPRRGARPRQQDEDVRDSDVVPQ